MMIRTMLLTSVIALASAATSAAGMEGMQGMDHSMHDMHAGHAMQMPAEQAPVVKATGVVKKVDLAAGKVTITHDPIPELKWPAMTMRFTFRDAKMVEGLKAGDRVNFTFTQEGKLSVLQSISR